MASDSVSEFARSLYMLNNAGTRRALHIRPAALPSGAPVLPASEYWAISRDERAVTQPLDFVADDGSVICDFLSVDCRGVRFVTQRFKSTMEESGASGFSTYPVRIAGYRADLSNVYRGLAVHGRVGELLDRGVVREVTAPSGRRARMRFGWFVDPATWTGHDFCLIGSSAHIVVTEKVVEAIRRAGLSNVVITRLDEVEQLDYPIEWLT